MDPKTAEAIAAIHKRLDDGDARFASVEKKIEENTGITQDIRDILQAVRSGLKVLGGLGEIAKWFSYIAAGILGAWSLFKAWKTGTPPGK